MCLDSDTDSEHSFEQWRLKPCSASQPANLLGKVVEKDDEADHPLPVEQSLLDHYDSAGTPFRGSSVGRDCTLDPCGSDGFNFPIQDGPTISSTSKRAASSLLARDEVLCNSKRGLRNECISDDDLGFISPTVERANARSNAPETNLDSNFSTLRARNLNNQLQEVHNEPETQPGGIRKKRKVTSGIPMSDEDKALERNEKLRAKEAERLRKAEEKAEMKRLKDEEKKRLQGENRRKREVCNVHTFA